MSFNDHRPPVIEEESLFDAIMAFVAAAAGLAFVYFLWLAITSSPLRISEQTESFSESNNISVPTQAETLSPYSDDKFIDAGSLVILPKTDNYPLWVKPLSSINDGHWLARITIGRDVEQLKNEDGFLYVLPHSKPYYLAENEEAVEWHIVYVAPDIEMDHALTIARYVITDDDSIQVDYNRHAIFANMTGEEAKGISRYQEFMWVMYQPHKSSADPEPRSPLTAYTIPSGFDVYNPPYVNLDNTTRILISDKHGAKTMPSTIKNPITNFNQATDKPEHITAVAGVLSKHAPSSEIALYGQNVLEGHADYPHDITLIVWGNYGCPRSGAMYNPDSEMVDKLQNPVVVASGNYNRRCGDSFSTSPTGVTASKNAITVGSVGFQKGDTIIPSEFSSHGPTADGRMLPLLMAHGQGVDTTCVYGACEVDGTSFSAPKVAAVIGRLQQYYSQARAGFVTPPSTYKTLLAHTATDMSGGALGLHSGPDNVSGYGVINPERALEMADNVTTEYINPGESIAWDITVDGDELKVTVAWDDAVGTISGKAIINDYDLYAIAPDGKTYGSWVLSQQRPSEPAQQPKWNTGTAGTHNVTDPIEQVFVKKPQKGIWRIVVSGRKVNTSGVVSVLSDQLLVNQIAYTPETTASFETPSSIVGNEVRSIDIIALLVVVVCILWMLRPRKVTTEEYH